MPQTLFLMLPRYAAETPGTIRHWWLVADGAVVDGGHDGHWPDLLDDDAAAIALAPADDAPVHYHLLPGLTAPQAQAAAKAQASDRLLGAAVHCAAGLPSESGSVGTAHVAHAAMAQWQMLLDAADVKIAAMVPIAALLPQPAAGEAIRALIGDTDLLRTEALCAVADPVVDPLRLNGLALVDIGRGDHCLTDLVESVPLDLLSGAYAPRAVSALSPAIRRWLLWLTAALVVLSLTVPLAQAWQRSRTIDAADARTLAAAARAGVEGSDAASAEAELDRRLAARGGGPLTLSAPLGGLYRSLQAHTPVAVRSLAHSANGTLTVTLASPRIEDVNAVLNDLQARGFVVTGQPLSGSDGMQMAAITIRAVP